MVIGDRASFKRALAEAQRMQWWTRIRALRDGRMEVRGRVGDLYVVRTDADGELWCTCAAGVRERPCWHAAAAYLDDAARAAFRQLSPAPPLTRRAVDSVMGRPSGRGIGISPTAMGSEEYTLAEALAAAGWRP